MLENSEVVWTSVQVNIINGYVWIQRGVQSFMLAYEAETDRDSERYANQLRAALGLPTEEE